MIITIFGICIAKVLKAAFILFVVTGDYPSKNILPDCGKLNNDAPKLSTPYSMAPVHVNIHGNNQSLYTCVKKLKTETLSCMIWCALCAVINIHLKRQKVVWPV